MRKHSVRMRSKRCRQNAAERSWWSGTGKLFRYYLHTHTQHISVNHVYTTYANKYLNTLIPWIYLSCTHLDRQNSRQYTTWMCSQFRGLFLNPILYVPECASWTVGYLDYLAKFSFTIFCSKTNKINYMVKVPRVAIDLSSAHKFSLKY